MSHHLYMPLFQDANDYAEAVKKTHIDFADALQCLKERVNKAQSDFQINDTDCKEKIRRMERAIEIMEGGE